MRSPSFDRERPTSSDAMSRRTFVNTTAAAAGLSAFSAGRLLGASERVGIGIIGFGLVCRIHTRSCMAQGDTDIVAIADTYQPRVEEGIALSGGRAKGYA